MTSTETEARDVHRFVRGGWKAASGGGTFDADDSFTELRGAVTIGSRPVPF